MNAAVLTVSDRSYAGEREDLSGTQLVKLLEADGWTIAAHDVVPDEKLAIIKQLLSYADEQSVNLVLTTGGTGAGPRDVTPEATRISIEKPFPGIAEALRTESAKSTPYAMISRGVAGSRGHSLIINFPGSPKAIEQLWPVIAKVVGHACRLLSGEDDPHT